MKQAEDNEQFSYNPVQLNKHTHENDDDDDEDQFADADSVPKQPIITTSQAKSSPIVPPIQTNKVLKDKLLFFTYSFLFQANIGTINN